MTPPIQPGTAERILRAAQMRDMIRRSGYEAGRAEAAALYERRLSALEAEVAALRDALGWRDTERIDRGGNSG